MWASQNATWGLTINMLSLLQFCCLCCNHVTDTILSCRIFGSSVTACTNLFYTAKEELDVLVEGLQMLLYLLHKNSHCTLVRSLPL